MSATKFCSACGEKIGRNHGVPLVFKPVCRRCRKRPRLAALAPLAFLGCCTLLGFFIGRLTAPREPFPFIGTPIDRLWTRDPAADAPAGSRPDDGKDNSHETGTGPIESAAAETFGVCGAPTKSGRPCRRKVRGGGYCWQHKDKVKPVAPPSRPAQNRGAVAPREGQGDGETLHQNQ
jgi:hypothetical protein